VFISQWKEKINQRLVKFEFMEDFFYMNYTGQNKLELFVDNAQITKREFAWQNTLTKRLAALLYAQVGKTVYCMD
jgi:hypothetical protein